MGPAEDLEGVGQGIGGVVEGVNLVEALVRRQAEGHPGAPQAAGDADGRPVVVAVTGSSGSGRLVRQAAVLAEMELELPATGGPQVALPAPVPRRLQAIGARLVVALDVDADGVLVHDAVFLTPEPVVAPARDLGDPVDTGSGHGDTGSSVIPGADEHPFRDIQMLEAAQRRIGVTVAPATDHEHGTLQLVIAPADASGAPVRPIGLVGEPFQDVRGVALEVLLPHGGPLFAAVLRIGRHGVHADHRYPVGADVVVTTPGAAAVVALVRVAVVGEVHGNDRRQVLGPMGGDLHGRETAVGAADHADLAGAPGLPRDPVYCMYCVELFLRCVLVGVRALTAAGAAAIESRADETVSGELVLQAGVGRGVVLAVGDVLEQQRLRRLLPIAVAQGDVQVHGELGAIAHRHHDVADEYHSVFRRQNDHALRPSWSTAAASVPH